MKYDISFLSPNKGIVEMPLRITGKVTGAYTIVQQFITTLFATPSNLREFGGGLYDLLQGSNVSEEHVVNSFNLATAETAQYLTNNGIIIGSCEINNVTINNDSVIIQAELFVSGETVSFALSIFLQEQ